MEACRTVEREREREEGRRERRREREEGRRERGRDQM